MADRYRRGTTTARRLASTVNAQIEFFWQPVPFAEKPSEADEPLWPTLNFDPAGLPTAKRHYVGTLKASGVDAIDLSTVFDNETVPIFFDSSHTNERGAAIVAAKMYDVMKPDLLKGASD